MTKPLSYNEEVQELLRRSYDDPVFFHEVVIGSKKRMTPHQKYICRLVAKSPVTVVQSANGCGKSWLAGLLPLWYLYTRPGSIILTTSPTGQQLKKVLWGYIRAHHAESQLDLGGTFRAAPYQELRLSDDCYAIGIATTKQEPFSGFHRGKMLAIIDEASGVSPEIFSAIIACNPEKLFMIGNPIRSDGSFHQYCQDAKKPGSKWGFHKMSAFDSPDIHLERSPNGFADQTFLDNAREIYGENTPWWVSHILGEYPDSLEDVLVPKHWLNAAVEEYERLGYHTGTTIKQSGLIRMGVDYAEGVGRDYSVITVRDTDALYALESSNTWSPEVLAQKVLFYKNKFNIDPTNIAWDANGPGSDFQFRLSSVGILSCRPFKGSNRASVNTVGANLRANSFWALRRRLDPSLHQRHSTTQKLFAISKQHAELLRPQFAVTSYEMNALGKVLILNKDDLKKKLGGKSPDYVDSLAISFCFGGY